jgi:predicted DNA-binding transcriptional regulator AlpA
MNEVMTGKDLGLSVIRGRLLVVSEIAKFLRVSERWIYKHQDDGTFPFSWFPIGERNRAADSADLEDWLKDIVVAAGTAPLPLKAIKKIRKEVSAQ